MKSGSDNPQHIENSTFTISKSLVLAGTVLGLCTSIASIVGGYYSSKQGTRDVIYEIKLNIKDVTNRNDLQDGLIKGSLQAGEFNYSLIQKLQDKTDRHEEELIELKFKCNNPKYR